MQNLPARLAMVAALALIPASLVHADMIYSNFGSVENQFDMDAGAIIAQSSDLQPSFVFTPATNQILTEVDFVASIGDIGDTNVVTVSLSQDSNGHPGTVIASQEFDGAMGVLGGEALDPSAPPVVLNWDPSDISLVGGTSYWITLSSPAPGDVSWNFNTDLQEGYSEVLNGTWQFQPQATMGALQILGTDESSPTAPESGTELLMGLGLAAFGGFRWRGRLTKVDTANADR